MSNYKFRQPEPLIEKAMEGIHEQVEQEEKKISKFQLTYLNDLITIEFPASEWVAEGLIPKGITMLTGWYGTNKTWLLLYFALCIAKGDPIFGVHPTTKGKVLIVEEENGERLLKERLQMLSGGLYPDDKSIAILSYRGIKVDNEVDHKELLNLVKNEGFNVIMFDPLIAMHTKNENDNSEMAVLSAKLKDFFRLDCSTIIVHHHGKDAPNRQNNTQSFRGASEIIAQATCHLIVEVKDEFLLLTQAKLRTDKRIPPFKLQLFEKDNHMSFEYLGEHDDAKIKREEAEAIITDLLTGKEWMDRRDIIQELDTQGYGETTTDNALKAMLTRSALEQRERPENRRIKQYKWLEIQTKETTEALS